MVSIWSFLLGVLLGWLVDLHFVCLLICSFVCFLFVCLVDRSID